MNGRRIRVAIGVLHRGPGRCVRQLAAWAGPFTEFPRGDFIATAIGVIPAAVSLFFGLPGHHFVSAVLLAWLVLGTIPDERRGRGMALLATAYVAHCILIITAAFISPEAAALVLPDSKDYWHKQEIWITTGVDPEYALTSWLPRHLGLAAAAVCWTSLSLGVMTFVRGFYEVDLMNYYNGRLLAVSDDPLWALALGWHPWSLIRGAGFLVLTWECTALGYFGWTGVFVGANRRRWSGWLAGIGLLIADGVIKLLLMEPVRAALERNLRS